MTRFLHTAIDRLHSTFSGQLQTELTDVETDNSLTVGGLPVPNAFIAAHEPGRNVTPLMLIYEDPDSSFDFTHNGVGQRHGNDFFEVNAEVVYLMNTGVDVAGASVNLRHILTAMVQVIENNRNLGVATLESEIKGANVGQLVGFDNESSSRRGVQMFVKIWGHSDRDV